MQRPPCGYNQCFSMRDVEEPREWKLNDPNLPEEIQQMVNTGRVLTITSCRKHDNNFIHFIVQLTSSDQRFDKYIFIDVPV